MLLLRFSLWPYDDAWLVHELFFLFQMHYIFQAKFFFYCYCDILNLPVGLILKHDKFYYIFFWLRDLLQFFYTFEDVPVLFLDFSQTKPFYNLWFDPYYFRNTLQDILRFFLYVARDIASVSQEWVLCYQYNIFWFCLWFFLYSVDNTLCFAALSFQGFLVGISNYNLLPIRCSWLANFFHSAYDILYKL